MFFSTGSGRVLGGSQETLFLISGSHYVDLDETPVPVERFLDGDTMDRLLEGAESVFNRQGSNALMKCKTVRMCAHAISSSRARSLSLLSLPPLSLLSFSSLSRSSPHHAHVLSLCFHVLQ
jgi:hypothetical protein